MNDFLTSILRTFVPIMAGFIITQFARLGIEIDTALVSSFVTGLVTTVYYSVFRWLETLKPKFGWFLGKPKTPKYN